MRDLNPYLPSAKNLLRLGLDAETAIRYSGHAEELLYTKAFGKLYQLTDTNPLTDKKVEALSTPQASTNLGTLSILFEYKSEEPGVPVNDLSLLRVIFAYEYLTEDNIHYMLRHKPDIMIAAEYPDLLTDILGFNRGNFKVGNSESRLITNLRNYLKMGVEYPTIRFDEYLSPDWENFNRVLLYELAERLDEEFFATIVYTPVPLSQWEAYQNAPIEWLETLPQKNGNPYV